LGSLNLNEYLDTCRYRPFEWGVHDCLTFSNSAFKAYHGIEWSNDWLGRYMVNDRPMRKKEMILEFGFDDFIKALDQRYILKRISGFPKKGCLVVTTDIRRFVTGYALGISNGDRAIFVGKNGILFKPMASVKFAWVKHD